ncbi:AAA family ATPase, partial [Gardnerella vaginalis]|uniref:AAA family ATPase n=1 Tax=Gardnerella vaginalis TaxID=2702 RepID=UPI0039F11D67
TNLRKIIKDNEIECENLKVNSIMRKSIWNYFKEDLHLDTIEIDASKSDAKEIWSKISTYMPVYSLFQSDRANTDSDSEVQDPLKEAVKIILCDVSIQESLNDISKKVEKNYMKYQIEPWKVKRYGS